MLIIIVLFLSVVKILCLLFIGFLFFKLFGFILKAIDGQQGTYEERAADPKLNTKDWDQHQKRLNKFGCSNYRRTMFYVEPKGGVYYVTKRGTKFYY